MKTAIVSALLGAGVLAAASANASTIFDETGFFETDAPVKVSFTGTSADTTIAFSGFDVVGFDFVADISLTTDGGSNLLSQTWSFTPAPAGSGTAQVPDIFGTGATGFEFGGSKVAGSFDEFSQNVATIKGQTYDLDFSLLAPDHGPAEVFATASSVPEPATWTLALAGFGGLGAALRSRRRAALAA
jgi:hypothetical protein